jgi:hypothetical protein
VGEVHTANAVLSHNPQTVLDEIITDRRVKKIVLLHIHDVSLWNLPE